MAGNFIFFCPELLRWLFDKVKFKDLKLAVIRQTPDRSTTELPLLIVPMSSPTIGNTNVSFVLLSVRSYVVSCYQSFFVGS
jgi:hypothetical protein